MLEAQHVCYIELNKEAGLLRTAGGKVCRLHTDKEERFVVHS